MTPNLWSIQVISVGQPLDTRAELAGLRRARELLLVNSLPPMAVSFDLCNLVSFAFQYDPIVVIRFFAVSEC